MTLSQFPPLSSGVSVVLRSHCVGRWDVLALKKSWFPWFQGGRSSQGLTAITGAPSGKRQMRKRGSQAAAGDLLYPAGRV